MPKLVRSILDKSRLDDRVRVRVHDLVQEKNRLGGEVAAEVAVAAAAAVAAVVAAKAKKSDDATKVHKRKSIVDEKVAAKILLGQLPKTK